ncbi:Cytochrome P450 [Elaphomyces granulatus]
MFTQFGSKGKFFVKPDMVFRPQIMVPREHIRWFLQQPQDVLSVQEARYEKFGLEFVLPGHEDDVDLVFLDAVHRKLMTRNLVKLQRALAEEVSRNIDAALGTDTENWVEANVWVTVEKTVVSALMCILAGQSVCRNDAFWKDVSGFTNAFGFSSILIGRILPKFLKPILGWPLSGLTLIRLRKLMKKWYTPLVKERFTGLLKKSQDPNFDYTPPQDLITWTLDSLLNTGNVERCNPNDVCRLLTLMISVAVPTVQTTTTNVIYDMLSSPPDMKVREHLYNEIVNALDTSPGKGWADQDLLPRLVFLNSAIRETLRCNPASVIAVERKVVPKEGVTLPSGQHLPKGSLLGVPVVGIHSDENIYPNAAKYEPFRFCNRKPGEEPDGRDTAISITSTGDVNITDIFLSFGAGKFACPGRWLASHVIKLTIAYLLYNYELKPYSQRPPSTVIFGNIRPNSEATMIVHRRKH